MSHHHQSAWGGDWGYNQGATFNIVVDDNNKLVIDKPSFDITLNGTDFAAGSIMTFIEVKNLYSYFPQVKATLDALYLDGKLVSGYDASKVVNANDGAPYRLELEPVWCDFDQRLCLRYSRQRCDCRTRFQPVDAHPVYLQEPF